MGEIVKSKYTAFRWVMTNLDTLRASVTPISRELYDKVVTEIKKDLLELAKLKENRDEIRKIAHKKCYRTADKMKLRELVAEDRQTSQDPANRKTPQAQP